METTENIEYLFDKNYNIHYDSINSKNTDTLFQLSLTSVITITNIVVIPGLHLHQKYKNTKI